MGFGSEVIAGGLAGVCSTLVAHPLDTIRTRVQTGVYGGGTLETIQQTFRSEGASAFYKGMAFPLVAQFFYKSVIFSSSGAAEKGIRAATGNSSSPLSSAQVMLCGAFGGGVNSFVVTPVELVRNRLMVQRGKTGHTGPVQCVRSVLATEGPTGLWRGLSSTLARDVPGVAAWMATFGAATAFLASQRASRGSPGPLSMPERLLAGSMAGVGFWVVALPFDTVKSVVQTDAAGRYRGLSGLLGATRDLLADGGPARMYRGFSVAATRGIPGSAITFTVYSTVKDMLA